MISGLIMGLAKQLAWKIVEKKYAGTEIAADEAEMNRRAMQMAGPVVFGLLISLALLIWAIVAIFS